VKVFFCIASRSSANTQEEQKYQKRGISFSDYCVMSGAMLLRNNALYTCI